MSTSQSRRPTVAWAAAGLPLVVTLGQTLMALFGYTSASAGVEPVTGPLLSVPVLFEAAVVFKESSGVVMALFLLIAVAWASQGVTMHRLEHREATFGAATLGSVLFFVLFFGVYAPLYGGGTGVGPVQLGLFSLVPILASGLMVYAASDYPWAVTVDREASEELGEIEASLDDAQATFREAFDRRLDGFEELSTTAPEAVDTVEQRREEFQSQVDDARQLLADCRSIDDPERRRSRAGDARRRVDELRPTATVDRIESGFRDRLTDAVRGAFGDRTVESAFGSPYEVVNLPTRFREFDVPGVEGDVHVREVDRALIDLIESDASVATVASAVDGAHREFDRLERHVADRETPVVETIRQAESDLETAESEVERDRLPFADRLSEVVVDGRTEATPGTRELRRELRRVRDRLHDCEFDTAGREADTVATSADRLVVFVEFAGAVWSAVDTRASGSNVPEELDDDLVSVLATAVERADEAVAVAHEDDRLSFEYADVTPDAESTEASDETDETDATDPTDADGGSETDNVQQPEAVVDEVLYVLRELSTAAERGETFLQYNLDDLPSSMATADVLVNTRRFVDRQTDLFGRVDLQSPEPPGFFELTAADDTDVETALSTARERFRDRYV